MTVPQIGGNVIPETMAFRGLQYLYDPGILLRNGKATAIQRPFATLVWVWSMLDQPEFDWWYTTLLGNEASQEFSGAGTTKLFNNLNVLTDHDRCTVYRPTYGFTNGSLYRQVQIEIGRLVVSS